MASQLLDPLFDLASYARPGPGRRDQLTLAQTQQVARTVSRTPEVMVKVLPRGANDLGAVRRHLDYIGRKGDVDLETDDGQSLREVHVGADLLEDWDLELEAHRSRADLISRPRQQVPRLVHKLMFSMPAGTPPDKVLKAVQNFFREEFALKHRYAMALHTDEPHPHVHVVIKAISEQGVRLNIRNAMRRRWRLDFARHLRALGVPANATDRFVRGDTISRKSDGIYRASKRGESTHMRERAETVTQELAKGKLEVEPGKASLVWTRNEVRRAWLAVGDILIRERQPELAAHIRQFSEEMAPPRTEKEWLASSLVARAREPKARQGPTR
jgi:hypothetical protein